jgi:hypothetical protein
MVKIGEMVSDAIRYPFTDWKKILILGILVLISNVYSIISSFDITSLSKTNLPLLLILIIVLFIPAVISALLSSGYTLRMIKSSVAGISELPEFDALVDMFIDGLKLAVTTLIYIIPYILIIIGITVLAVVFKSGFLALAGIVIAFVYLLIVLPILAMALANMAYHDEFGAAFRFSEIFDKIRRITWGNFIVWYLVMILVLGILYLVLIGITAALIDLPIISILVSSLFFGPYISMFLARSVALEYISD